MTVLWGYDNYQLFVCSHNEGKNHKELVVNIGDKIKTKRLEFGLTLEQFAEKTGIDKSYLSRIENNKFKRLNSGTIVTLSKALEVEAKWFQDVSERDNNILPNDFFLLTEKEQTALMEILKIQIDLLKEKK
ncbi:MAG: helix-turn-helix transcriptional regulator [bacterium]|nr:helix-turn-helix transcriptional regulator [bacterium]